MTNPYEWTQDPMLNDMADENPSIANEDFNYLKYETDDLRNYGVPFSVNSGTRNASGYADFIAKVSGTEISFKGWSFDSGVTYGGNGYSGIAQSNGYTYIVNGNKVYNSTDNGASWDAGTVYRIGGQSNYIAAYGANVYIADYDNNKVYKSTDNGVNWDSGVYFGGSSLSGIAAWGSSVWVTDIQLKKIFKSIDGGVTWDAGSSYNIPDIGGGISAYKNTVMFTAFPSTVVYKSVDGGATWDSGTNYGASYGEIGGTISIYNDVVYVASSPQYPSTISKIYKSADGGTSWSYTGSIWSSGVLGSFFNGKTLFVINGADQKIYKSLLNTQIIITYPDGTRETHDSLPNITGISADGTYTVLLEKGTATPIAITSAVTESWGLPASATNGDYVCDISIKPLQTYKRVNGIWYPTQYVKLGEFTRTAGTIATPVSYAFNGEYVSADTALTAGATQTVFAHNIGTQLYNSKFCLRCITAELGFSINDVSTEISTRWNAASPYYAPFTPSINKNTATYTTGTGASYLLIHKTTGVGTAITNTNWKQFIKIKRDF